MSHKPDWADERHIDNGNSVLCHDCLLDGEEIALEVEDEKRLATWMGVNWEDGYKEVVRCPQCDKRGQITTKLMNERTERTRFSRLGAAAIPKPEVEHGRVA